MSEGETHLSSCRAAASRSMPQRSAHDPGAYVEERQASHHTAGLTSHKPSRVASCSSLSARNSNQYGQRHSMHWSCFHFSFASRACRSSRT